MLIHFFFWLGGQRFLVNGLHSGMNGIEETPVVTSAIALGPGEQR